LPELDTALFMPVGPDFIPLPAAAALFKKSNL